MGQGWKQAWLALWHAPGRAVRAALKAGSLATWMQWGAGVAASLIAVGFLLVIWLGPWPDREAGKRLDLLGQGQLMAWATVLVSLAAIAGLRLAFSGGKDGFKAGVERDDDPPPAAVVTTTTTVETPAGPPPTT
jgi:hypothetical protein